MASMDGGMPLRSSPSPLYGQDRPMRIGRRSPVYSMARRSPVLGNASTINTQSSAEKAMQQKVTFKPMEDDGSDDEEASPMPVLSALAQRLLEEEAEGASYTPTEEQGNDAFGGSATSYSIASKTPARERTLGGSSTSSGDALSHKSSPSQGYDGSGNEFVTPAPRSRSTRRPMNPYNSGMGSSGSSETDKKYSYGTSQGSAVRPTGHTTFGASAMRWRRAGTTAASVPRRGPFREASAYQEYQTGQHQYEQEEEEEESPVERKTSPSPQMGENSGSRYASEQNSGSESRRPFSYVRRRSPVVSPSHSHDDLAEKANKLAISPPMRAENGSPLPRSLSGGSQQQPDSPTPMKSEHVHYHRQSSQASNKENLPPPAFRLPTPEPPAKASHYAPSSPQQKPRAASPVRQNDRASALHSRSTNTPHRPAPPPPPKMSIVDAATNAAGAGAATDSKRSKSVMQVHGRQYTRLSSLGRGGSCRVYKVMAENYKVFALKKVSFKPTDAMQTIAGYKGEIELLTKLKDEDRVVRLFDWEINDSRGYLSLIMECGETTFGTLLASKIAAEDSKLDISFVRHYWREMLLCVDAVHRNGIVHSDLKPVNFIIVQGKLKLIDFGIANAIQDDTVNVHREALVGTLNYMSPESMTDANSPGRLSIGGNSNKNKIMKVGAPSDVWSLGCILYQMVYGSPPFASLGNDIVKKCYAITSDSYQIEFPSLGLGGVPVPRSLLYTMKMCLLRDKHARATISELLSDQNPFLHPDRVRDGVVDVSQETLRLLLKNAVEHCVREGKPSDELVGQWAKDVYGKLERKMMMEYIARGDRDRERERERDRSR